MAKRTPNAGEQASGSTTAKLVYRPVGIVGSVVSGAVAGAVVKQVWRLATGNEDPPQALQSEYKLRSVLVAAALQGLVFAIVKAAVDRGGARLFERLTGEWPGD